MHPPRDPLDDLLERWQAESPPAPMAPEVWRRIAAAESAPATVNAPAGWLARLETVFTRPSFAVVFVTACVFLGLFLAEARLARLQAERNAQVARQYLELIDPLFAVSGQPGPGERPRP